MSVLLRIEGEVDRPLLLTFTDFLHLPQECQRHEVQCGAKLSGATAVRLESLLQLAGVRPAAAFISLHSSHDDFHASLPLSAVREQALLIYMRDGKPLPQSLGGPLRFFVPEHASCHTSEIDECANVKYVDRLELTRQRGYDNRPTEDAAHAELHRRQAEQGK
jgi:DMSO/TMAO reductase YedYZ molybdopterin-dependent catalytic subunit